MTNDHHQPQPKRMPAAEETRSINCKHELMMEDKQTRPKDISCLPEEVLAIIFHYLDVGSRGRVAKVCHHWLQVSRQKSVWNGVEVQLELQGNDPSQCRIASVSHFGQLIRHFKRPCYLLPDRFPYITAMAFTSTCNAQNPFSIQCVNLLVQRFTNLTSLTFSFHKEGGHLLDTSMGIIRDHLKSLKHLYLDEDAEITDEGISQLVGWNRDDDGYPHLETLGLSYCPELTDLSLKYLSVFQPSLQNLNLGFTLCTNVGLQYISQMPQLVQLELDDCYHMSGAGFKHLSQMVMLRVLHLKMIFVGDVGVAHLANGGSRITMLKYGPHCGITDDCGSHLAQLVHLERLSACYSGISNATLAQLTISHIKRLNLYNCKEISDDSLKHLAKLPSLQKLNLKGCNISDDGLANLLDGGSVISKLAFGPCNVTDQGLKQLSRLPCLTNLFFVECNAISVAGLAHLGRGAALITKLQVFRGTRLGRKTLLNIAWHLNLLKKLILNKQHVSDLGMYLVGQKCAHLLPNLEVSPEYSFS